MEIRKLNALRGIAALIVALSHYSNHTHLLGRLLGFGAGQLGVMIFFILSGFLMSVLYMDKPFCRSQVGWFAVARVARVVPLYLLVVVASYLLTRAGMPHILYPIRDVESLISHLALMSGVSVLWTIPTEMQFYVLFVLFWWIHSRNTSYLYILFALILLVLMFFNFPSLGGDILGIPYFLNILPTVPFFLVGVVFGQLYRNWQPPPALVSGIFVAAFLILPFLYPGIYHLLTGQDIEMWSDMRVLIALAIFFFFLVFFVPERNILLSNRLGDFLGKISYSLYLLHSPVLVHLPHTARHHPVLFLGIFLGASIGLSYLSYLLIEHPSRKFIRALAARHSKHWDRTAASVSTGR